MMVKLVPFTNPMHEPAMFWTFDRLQLFVWAAKIRNKCARAENIETMPSNDRIQPSLKERVERESRQLVIDSGLLTRRAGAQLGE